MLRITPAGDFHVGQERSNMENEQHATPVLINDGYTIVLQRVPFRERVFDEDWLQKLLFENRTVLPFAELEPAFTGSIPLVRELPTNAGPVDLLYMNSKGYLTIVETKLWRNPEARRSVVAQIIDYAKEMAGWSYDRLVSAIKNANKIFDNSDPLLDIFSEAEGEDFDQRIFIDRVTRNLQDGKFLLLIVGDGIQEGVEKMVDFLQQTPRLGFSLALVELAVYRESPEKKYPLYIQPKILIRTKEITRAIVELKIPVSKSDILVSLPSEPPTKSPYSRKRITEEEFLGELRRSFGDDEVNFAKWVLEEAIEQGLRVDWKEAGPILKYDDPDSGEFFTLGQLRKDGLLAETSRLYQRFDSLGWPLDACFSYFDQVASLIPSAVRKSFKSKSGNKWEQVAYGNTPTAGSHPPFFLLEPSKEKWFFAIQKLINRIISLSEGNK